MGFPISVCSAALRQESPTGRQAELTYESSTAMSYTVELAPSLIVQRLVAVMIVPAGTDALNDGLKLFAPGVEIAVLPVKCDQVHE